MTGHVVVRVAATVVLILFPFIFPALCFAQPGGAAVWGNVRDTTGCAVPYATVVVYHAPAPSEETDSLTNAAVTRYAGAAVTDVEGYYRIALPGGGTYRLVYEHLAYAPSGAEVAVQSGDVRCDVALEPITGYIEAVTVTGAPIKYSAGKYEVKIEGNTLARNRNASELLGLLPGVTSHEGIKLYGRAVDMVYLNGRKVEDINELSALQAENIASVVVQNMAGASEDATATGGVIRIRLRRAENRSYYGTVSGNASFTSNMAKYTLPFTFNYRSGRLNIYNYFNANYVAGHNEACREEQFRPEGYTLDSEIEEHYSNYSLSETLGVVYDITDRHSLGFTARAMMWNGKQGNVQNSVRRQSAVGGAESSDLVYEYRNDRKIAQYQSALNYIFAIDTLGSNLSLKADYVRFDQVAAQDYSTVSSSVNAEERYREKYSPSQDMLDVRLDLDKNFRPGATLKAGARFYFNAAHDVRSRVDTAGEEPPAFGNKVYITTTQGAALFGEYSGSYEKFAYLFGLRGQWDRLAYSGTDMAPGKRNYWRLFPSLSLAYTFDRQRGSNLNLDVYRYSGGLPPSMALSPLPVRMSENSYRVGNPDLEPSDGFSAALTCNLRGLWSFSYGFFRTRNLIQNLTTVLPGDHDVLIISPVNLGMSSSHSLSVGVNTTLTEWLRLSASVTGAYGNNRYGSLLYDEWHAELYASLMFSILPTMGAQLNFSGSSPVMGLETRSNDSYGLNGSIYKTFFAGRLYAALSFGGLFYQKWRVNETVKADGSYYSITKTLNHNRQWIGVQVRFNFARNPHKPFKMVQTLQNIREEF